MLEEAHKTWPENLEVSYFLALGYDDMRKKDEAMELLKDPGKTEFTVLEILYEVGFNSKPSFNTAFKKYTQTTPTQYRKKHLGSAA